MLLAIVLTGHVTHFHGSLADNRSGLPTFASFPVSFSESIQSPPANPSFLALSLLRAPTFPQPSDPSLEFALTHLGKEVGTYHHPLLATLLEGGSGTDNPKKLSVRSQFTHFSLFFLEVDFYS